MLTALYFLPAATVPTAWLWWSRHAPRRDALATLRVATASAAAPTARVTPTRPPAPGRNPGGTSTGPETLRPSPGPRPGRASVFDRAGHAVGKVARGLSPPGYATSARRRLVLAGWERAADADRFLASRLASLVLVAPTFLAVQLVGLPGLYRLLAFVLAIALLGLGPDAVLNRAVSRRQEKIRRELAPLVELLMISVEAGLGLDQALMLTVGSLGGTLGEEFSRFLGEVRIGADRKEALEALDLRTDVAELRSFLMALAQAAAFGVPVASILRSQAAQVRLAQRQHVQESAQKAPIKMLFPLVFCVMPALFIVVIGPAGIEIYKTIIR